MVSTQSKEFTKVAQVKSSINRLVDNMECYEATEEEWRNELAAAINSHTWLSQQHDDIHAKMID